jgi:rSAM/selenodomain-associated transferase 1
VCATDTRVVVFARAPEAGQAKTRLIPLLGAAGAARLQALLIERTLSTAMTAAIGRVELWCAPSVEHPLLATFLKRFDIEGVTQCEGDLGDRMQHAALSALTTSSRVILLGTDCPAMTVSHLRAAVAALDDTRDAVLIPAEDGGYVLLGLKSCNARLFAQIPWSGNMVMAMTRERLAELKWRWCELPALWDIDRAADVARLRKSRLMPELEYVLDTSPPLQQI